MLFRSFIENMKMLNEKISEIGIYTLNPKYVKEKIIGHDGIARACWLNNFFSISDFDATSRSVGYGIGRLRGVPLVAEGDVPKKIEVVDPISSSYQTLMNNEDDAVKKMTKQSATFMSRVLATYLSNLEKQ